MTTELTAKEGDINSGRIEIPGLIDTHVHFREPGLTAKGSIASESRAALAGGIASFIDMPNTVPPTLTPEALEAKYELAARASQANYGFFPGASEDTPKLLDAIPENRLPGVKLFMGTTTGAVATPSAAALDTIFRMCAERGLPIVVHAEDDAIIAAETAAAIQRHGGDRQSVPVSEHRYIRSRQACLSATARAVELAHRFGTHLHIAHVSTREELQFLSAGPAVSKLITAETTPLYLDPEFGRRTTTWRTKVNPAIKTADDAEALRDALMNQVIDTIGSDHAPHLPAHKQGGEFTAASGAPSIQFAVPVLLEYLPLDVIMRAMHTNPAIIFGIDTAALPGRTIVQRLDRPHTITDADVLTPAGWTPFAGRTVHYTATTTPFTPVPITFRHPHCD